MKEEITMTEQPIKHLSFSSLNSAGICLRDWHNKYILKMEQVYGEAAQFGLDFEACLAQQLGFSVPEETDGENEDAEIKEKVFDDEMQSLARFYAGYDYAWAEATEYQNKIEIDPDRFRWLAEKNDVKGVIHLPLIGYTDFENEETILDIKTSKRSGWKEDWGIQLTLYMLAQGKPMAEVHQLIRTKQPKMAFYNLMLTPEMAQAALEWVAARAMLIKAVVAGDIPPCAQVSWKCGFCADAHCPARAFSNVPPLG